MIRFSLFGIPVEVQPWFWISLAIISGRGTANSRDAVILLILFLLAGFISILVHELGHALTARTFGADSEITLQAFGGFATFSGARFTRAQHFLVTAAGPGVQILLGIAVVLLVPEIHVVTSRPGHFWLELVYIPRAPGTSVAALFAGCFWLDLAYISIVWALLNLLPVLPLDGGHMLNALLGPERIRTTLQITILTAVCVALLIYRQTGSIIFPLFMGLFVWQAWRALKQSPY